MRKWSASARAELNAIKRKAERDKRRKFERVRPFYEQLAEMAGEKACPCCGKSGYQPTAEQTMSGGLQAAANSGLQANWFGPQLFGSLMRF